MADDDLRDAAAGLAVEILGRLCGVRVEEAALGASAVGDQGDDFITSSWGLSLGEWSNDTDDDNDNDNDNDDDDDNDNDNDNDDDIDNDNANDNDNDNDKDNDDDDDNDNDTDDDNDNETDHLRY